MRTEVVERRLSSLADLSRQGKRINGLFRLLACPKIWETAYEAIAPNKGSLTPGIDPKNTLDGISLARIEGLMARVLDGRDLPFLSGPAGQYPQTQREDTSVGASDRRRQARAGCGKAGS